LLDIGKEPIFGEAREAVLREAAEDLIAEAIGTDIPTYRG
jgi:ATP-dependent Lhr-like helicase